MLLLVIIFFIRQLGNNLGDASISKFLLALQYQKTLMEMHKGQGTGLLRLVLTVYTISLLYNNKNAIL